MKSISYKVFNYVLFFYLFHSFLSEVRAEKEGQPTGNTNAPLASKTMGQFLKERWNSPVLKLEDKQIIPFMIDRGREKKTLEIEHYDQWEKRAILLINQQNHKNLVQLIYAIAVLRQKPSEAFLKKWEKKIYLSLRDLTVYELEEVMWSISKLNYDLSDQWIGKWGNSITPRLKVLDKKSLFSISYSLQTLKITPPRDFIREWEKALAQYLDSFESRDLINVFSDLYHFEVDPTSDLIISAKQRFFSLFQTLSPLEKLEVVYYYTKFEIRFSKEELDQIEKSWLAHLKRWKVQDLADAIWIFSENQHSPSKSFFDEWEQAFLDKKDHYDLKTLPSVFRSLTHLSLKPKDKYAVIWTDKNLQYLTQWDDLELLETFMFLSRAPRTLTNQFMHHFQLKLVGQLEYLSSSRVFEVLSAIPESQSLSLSAPFKANLLVRFSQEIEKSSIEGLFRIVKLLEKLNLVPDSAFSEAWFKRAFELGLNTRGLRHWISILTKLNRLNVQIPSYFLDEFSKCSLGHYHDINARSKKELCLLLANHGISLPSDLKNVFLSEFEQNLNQMKPSQVLWAFRGIQEKELSFTDELKTAIEAHLQKTAKLFSLPQWIELLGLCKTTHFAFSSQMKKFNREHLLNRIQEATPDQLVSMIHLYDQFPFPIGKSKVSELEQKLIPILKKLDASVLAKLLNLYRVHQQLPSSTFTKKWNKVVSQRIAEFQRDDLVSLVRFQLQKRNWGYPVDKQGFFRFFQIFEPRLDRAVLSRLSPDEHFELINQVFLERLNPQPSFLESWKETSLEKMAHYNPFQVIQSLKYFMLLNGSLDASFLNIWEAKVISELPNFTGENLVDSIWLMAKLASDSFPSSIILSNWSRYAIMNLNEMNDLKHLARSAWSLAVLQTDLSLHNAYQVNFLLESFKILAGNPHFKRKIENEDIVALRQVYTAYQYALSKFGLKLIDDGVASQWFSSASLKRLEEDELSLIETSGMSSFQREVTKRVRDYLGKGFDVLEEAWIPEIASHVDILIPQLNVIIQVDGAHHFINLEKGMIIQRQSDLLADVVLYPQYRVIHLQFTIWDAFRSIASSAKHRKKLQLGLIESLLGSYSNGTHFYHP
jgi:hypothetical protein